MENMRDRAIAGPDDVEEVDDFCTNPNLIRPQDTLRLAREMIEQSDNVDLGIIPNEGTNEPRSQ